MKYLACGGVALLLNTFTGCLVAQSKYLLKDISNKNNLTVSDQVIAPIVCTLFEFMTATPGAVISHKIKLIQL